MAATFAMLVLAAILVYIAVPPTCRKCLLLNWKLLQVSTSFSNSQMELFVGLSMGSRCLASDCRTGWHFLNV